MANPIIKIKRGSGVPTPAGITAGEFAFNKTGNILYVGACGGYTSYGSGSLGTAVANNDLNIIPIGMQISNDHEMGAGAELDIRAGYSNFTVPTTKAVREWVNQTKLNQVLGATFRAGPGIGVTTGQVGNSYDITISNTGVIKGFTGFSVTGNFHPSSNVVIAKSAIDGITFIGGGGIQLRGTNSTGTLEIQNYGVTSIGGFTGTISTFSPIVTLSGFTAGIGLAVRDVVLGTSPIVVKKSTGNANGFDGIDIEHSTQSMGSNASMTPYVNGVPQLLTVAYDGYGHLVAAPTQTSLSFVTNLPLGFTEAVQDAAYSGITNAYGPNNYGIDYAYDDAGNFLNTINRGITSLSVTGIGNPGLSGAVLLAVGTGLNGAGAQLSVAQSKINNTITYEYIGTQYKSFALKKPGLHGYNVAGIYAGGVTGAGVGTLTAAAANSTLNVVPGRGIGISMGVQSTSDAMFIWNAGINTIAIIDSNGANVVPGGLSGNITLQAGTNVDISRDPSTPQVVVISSSGGGAGGAVSDIKASYSDVQTDFETPYSGSGVTGGIVFKGQNGLITKQEITDTGTSTKNGDLYVALSSRVKIPAGVRPSGDYYSDAYQVLEIATIREGGIPQASPDIDYLDVPAEYSKLITDVVEGGFTGTFQAAGHGIDSGWRAGSFAPDNYTQFDGPNTKPGRILILRAREGTLNRSIGFDPLMTGLHAEIRLLGFPNPETMSGYINEVYDFIANPDGCPGGQCNQYPPSLPVCTLDDVNYNYTQDLASAENLKGTAVFHADIVARDSIFVQKDIWLTGELIDATTGCLYAAGNNTTSVFNGGNLGLTGDLVVNGSIYVHGGTAFFNVADLSTESPLLKIGGISASTGYSNPMIPLVYNINDATLNTDRGLVLFNHAIIPYGALHESSAINAASRANFIGIDSNDGVFKYIPTAQLVLTTPGGNQIGSYTKAVGRLGPAKFSEINNVGITADSDATISLKAAITNNPSSNSTGIDLKGFAAITASTTTGNKANITLGNSAKVSFGSAGASAVIDFPRGITFYPNANLNSTDFEGGTAFNGGLVAISTSSNNLRIRYAENNLTPRTISIRNPGANRFAQLVDNGKWAANDNQSPSGTIDADRQMIYNKTLADGTIIDCGTY